MPSHLNAESGMNTEIVISREMDLFKPVMENLHVDFGDEFINTLNIWIEDGPDDDEFWEVYLIRNNDKVIGICGLYSQYDNPDMKELWLGWFGIIPRLRNIGIGGVALSLMESRAKELGCSDLMSYVDAKGKPLAFYVRNGFSRMCSVGEYLKEHPELDMDSFENENDHVIRKELR